MSEAAVIVRHNSGEGSLPTAGSVLIIDDEAAIRESLETLLELEGYGVESAGSGEEGGGGLCAFWQTSFFFCSAAPRPPQSKWYGFFTQTPAAGSGAFDHYGH